MNIIDKLERKLGKFAIENLMLYIVILNAAVFILMQYDKTLSDKLALFPMAVMNGEVWRLITYVFIPPETSPIFIIFVLYFYYMMGSALEQEWGSFKFNIYYIIGMIGTTIVAFFFGSIAIGTATYLNLSLLFAFARLFPEYQILLFMIIPLKIKYLAWLNWAFFAYTVIFLPIPYKIVAVVSIINFFVFFGRDIVLRTKSYGQRKVYQAKISKDFTIHRCTICGKTEKDDPKMEFRYCSTCKGDYEYCMEHLKKHDHIV